MEEVLLDLVLTGAVKVEQILPWLKSAQQHVEVPEVILGRLKDHEPSLREPTLLQPTTLREAILNRVRLVSNGTCFFMPLLRTMLLQSANLRIGCITRYLVQTPFLWKYMRKHKWLHVTRQQLTLGSQK